jgi:hypothetical protein
MAHVYIIIVTSFQNKCIDQQIIQVRKNTIWVIAPAPTNDETRIDDTTNNANQVNTDNNQKG